MINRQCECFLTFLPLYPEQIDWQRLCNAMCHAATDNWGQLLCGWGPHPVCVQPPSVMSNWAHVNHSSLVQACMAASLPLQAVALSLQNVYQLACALWGPVPKLHHRVKHLQMTYGVALLEDVLQEFSVISLTLRNRSAPCHACNDEVLYRCPILLVNDVDIVGVGKASPEPCNILLKTLWQGWWASEWASSEGVEHAIHEESSWWTALSYIKQLP